jgi:hypothetical protein
VFAPIGEEPGWRGCALPRLLDGRSPFSATLVLAPTVALWHVPLIFIAGEDLAPIFLLATVAVTFFYTWLFVHTGGSVLITIVAHAAEGDDWTRTEARTAGLGRTRRSSPSSIRAPGVRSRSRCSSSTGRCGARAPHRPKRATNATSSTSSRRLPPSSVRPSDRKRRPPRGPPARDDLNMTP